MACDSTVKTHHSQKAFLWYRTHIVLKTGRRLDPWGAVMPDYGCPSGTRRRMKTGTNEEALGHMWYRTINAPKDAAQPEGQRRPLKLEGEPKLKKENTFLTFKIQEGEARANRPRAASDNGIVYGSREAPCDVDEDSDGDTLSTVATDDSRTRANSELDEFEVEAVGSAASDAPSPSSNMRSGMPSLAHLTKPPGVFTAPSREASKSSEEVQPALAALKVALRGQLSELSVAALRAEVEAETRDEAQVRKSSKKSFSLTVMERIAEQQKVAPITDAQRSTIQLRQLPDTMTRSRLVATLNAEGFRGSFDFVYVPIYFDSGKAFGYAFVNCISPEVALKMMDHFAGFTLWAGKAPTSEQVEPCEVGWTSPFQGLLEHLERYRNSPVMHSSVPDDHKPALFSNGLRIPFPEPTRKVNAPRVRKTLSRTS